MQRHKPSFLTAILTGAVAIPVLALGSAWIQRSSHRAVLFPIWLIVAFLLPVLFSTTDLTYFDERRKRFGRIGAYIVPATYEDIRDFHIPAALRLVAYFVAGVASVLLLRLCGVSFS